ncbi:MAG TPA: hypothetical protein VLD67_04425 [Vicinamibacterales bacterium]|nr:hypothetical protein [Vicinamibacterales bacterium]
MAARRTLDYQAGPLPEIRSEQDSVVFQFDIPGVARSERLLIRCDDEGNVWAAVASSRSGSRRNAGRQ